MDHIPDGDELDVVSFFYDVWANVFMDDDGYIVWDLFNYITPNDLYLFRRNKVTIIVFHRTILNRACELYYPSCIEDNFRKDEYYV